MSFRPVEESDRPLLEAGVAYFNEHVKGRPNKEWLDDIDPDHVINLALSKTLPAVLVDEAYLLVYVVAPFWLAPQGKAFSELVLIRVGRGGTMNNVVAAMETIAKREGCTRLFMDTSMAHRDEALARQMCKHGFSQVAIQLTKKL